MASAENKSMLVFAGCLQRNLDDKRRLQIPAKWYRKTEDGKIEETQYALILWNHEGLQDMCIQVLPPEVFQKLLQRVTNLPIGDPEGQALRRTMAEKMEIVNLDGQGRIMIPESMVAAADLKDGEVVMAGMLDYFQLWNPKRHKDTALSVAARAQTAVGKYV